MTIREAIARADEILRVEARANSDPLFADTFKRCWRLGQAELPANAVRFDELKARLSWRTAAQPAHAADGAKGREASLGRPTLGVKREN